MVPKPIRLWRSPLRITKLLSLPIRRPMQAMKPPCWRFVRKLSAILQAASIPVLALQAVHDTSPVFFWDNSPDLHRDSLSSYRSGHHIAHPPGFWGKGGAEASLAHFNSCVPAISVSAAIVSPTCAPVPPSLTPRTF